MPAAKSFYSFAVNIVDLSLIKGAVGGSVDIRFIDDVGKTVVPIFRAGLGVYYHAAPIGEIDTIAILGYRIHSISAGKRCDPSFQVENINIHHVHHASDIAVSSIVIPRLGFTGVKEINGNKVRVLGAWRSDKVV